MLRFMRASRELHCQDTIAILQEFTLLNIGLDNLSGAVTHASVCQQYIRDLNGIHRKLFWRKQEGNCFGIEM